MIHSRYFEFSKFLSVGAATTLLSLAVIFAAKFFLQLSDALANAFGYAVGFIVNFYLNSRWTFSYRGPALVGFLKFLAVALIAYAINLIAVMALIRYTGLNSYLCQALGIPFYTLTSYLLSKLFVFRSPAQVLPHG